MAIVRGPWRFSVSGIDFVRARQDLPWVGSYLSRTKSISETKNRHCHHTSAKSEISSHTYSNYNTLFNSRTDEGFSFTELPRSTYICVYINSYVYIYTHICTYTDTAGPQGSSRIPSPNEPRRRRSTQYGIRHDAALRPEGPTQQQGMKKSVTYVYMYMFLDVCIILHTKQRGVRNDVAPLSPDTTIQCEEWCIIIYICIQIHMCTSMYLHINTYVYINIYINLYMNIHIYVNIYIYIYMYISICMYTYT